MTDIPLKVLVIDPDKTSNTRLTRALHDHNSIISVSGLFSLDGAKQFIVAEDINAIYVDPLSLGIAPTSSFIEEVRAAKPEVVYVLYMRLLDIQNRDQNFVFGGFGFRLYFKLDKDTPNSALEHEVAQTVSQCQSDLAFDLNRVLALQEELRSLQRSAVEESVSVPVQMLRDIQDQLAAWREELNTKEQRRYAASFLGDKTESVVQNRCFVVMPYSQDWSEAVETILRSTCSETKLEFKIAKAMDGRFVPTDIWQGITSSALIIADLTGGNANVAYEVGLADAIGKEVILISQDVRVPFDFSGQRLIIYENSIAGSLKLKEQLRERLWSVKRRLDQSEDA